jgi:hypothetical protein
MTGALRAFGGGRRCFAPAPLLRSLYSLLLQHPVTRFPAAWGAPTRGETMDRQFRILKSRRQSIQRMPTGMARAMGTAMPGAMVRRNPSLTPAVDQDR